MPLANVVGDPDRMNSPNMRNDTGMIAVRLNSLDNIVVILPSCHWFENNDEAGARGGASTPPHATTLRGDLDLDLLGLDFLAQRQPHGKHAGLVLGADLAASPSAAARRAGERAIAALNAMELFLVDFRVELPLTTQRKRIVFDR